MTIKKESKGVEYYIMNKDDLPKKDKNDGKKKEVKVDIERKKKGIVNISTIKKN